LPIANQGCDRQIARATGRGAGLRVWHGPIDCRRTPAVNG
jgi:hypothetical protein